MTYHDMMYYDLTPGGNPAQTWLFRRIDPEAGLVLRDRYAAAAFPRCKKLDEFAALQSGIDPAARIRTKKDVCASAEWMLCAAERFQEVVAAEGVGGLEFLPLPGSPGMAVVLPRRRVPVRRDACGMRFVGTPCAACGRHREVLHTPTLASMDLPADPMEVFMPDVLPETVDGRMACFFATDRVAEVLKKHKLTGFDWKSSKLLA